MAYDAYHRSLPINRTNTATGTTYVPSAGGWELTGKGVVSIHLKVAGGVTVTFEASNEEPFRDAGKATIDWCDVTKFGVDLETGNDGNTNFADEETIVQFNGLCVNRFRLKTVRSDATNSELYAIKML
jgi:hypothetical protein